MSSLRALWESAGGNVPEHWEFKTIEDLLEHSKSISVGVMYPGQGAEVGIPLIKVSDVKNGGIAAKPKFCISEEVDEEYKRTRLNGTELLLTLVGNPGDCVVVTEGMAGWNAARALAVVRLADIELRTWLRYALLSKPAKHLIGARLNTTVQKTLNLKDVRELGLPIPPKEERESITKVIGAIERKTLVNRQTNQTLEHIAQAIFKSWFVDFEPTRAKVIAKEKGGNEEGQSLAAQAVICGAITLEQLSELSTGSAKMEDKLHTLIIERFHNTPSAGLDKWSPESISKLAEQFPNALVESELGEIPKGWTLECVGDHLIVTKGRSYKSIELEESNTALVTLKSFMRGGGYREDGLKAYTGTYKPEQVIEPGELVMSLTDVTQAAEIVGKPAIVTRNDAYETLVASLDVAILRPNEPVMKEFFYGLMSTYHFHRYAESFATGTTVLHLNSKGITSFEFPLPDNQLCKVYSDIVGPMLAKHEGNIHLSRSLEAMRNVLLPKLLSGELEISPKEIA